ncbi:adenosine deaminase [Enterocloster aldenensis]|uniref:adenine-specific methyltransferase EcoRI family protein n=1 Tax=Enterocloster aldenensis TaxID=358742 RepID=UPI000E41698C|nr:adenosine deaminase [Enterocloster aldenensis]
MKKRVVNHALLDKAKVNKKDEFYTQLIDIEREMIHYTKHFRDKVIYCNCDNPKMSNFWKYFYDHFNELELRELYATFYGFGASFYRYDGENLGITPLQGDGDFRSDECVQILKQSDVVVTNPPFSLFREYISQLDSHNKDFLIISNINAITYKEVFPLIQANKVWLGICFGRGISGFIVPENYELYGTETMVDENGNRIISPNNCMWLTSLDNEKRHQPIKLVKKYEGNEEVYPFYDNYYGINVNKTQDIPADYMGAMGVPITFLNKYNPEQFEIIKFRKGDDDKDLRVNGKAPYFRILIRRKIA